MSDDNGDEKGAAPASAPAWQQSAAEASAASHSDQSTTLEYARKFLQDESVKKETPERKAEFLRSKGVSEADIKQLLEELGDEKNAPKVHTQPAVESSRPTAQPADSSPSAIEKREDLPPIVTYPEFLTKRARPPPLVTVNGFLATLYSFGGLSALLYGTSKYVLEPMVESLTESRISLHETANESLARIVEKLEGTVSEIPPTIARPGGHDRAGDGGDGDDVSSSSYDDPTELFHRDVGVQTSLPTSPQLSDGSVAGGSGAAAADVAAKQARRITDLASSLRDISSGFEAQTKDQTDIRTEVGTLQTEMSALSYGAAPADMVGGFSLYGSAVGRNEQDDEIKRAKENIRRLKGILLSARSFPSSVR